MKNPQLNEGAVMFDYYPDVFTITDMKEALGVSNKMAYALIKSGKVRHFRMGKLIKIPKPCLLDYINAECYNLATTSKPCHIERSETT